MLRDYGFFGVTFFVCYHTKNTPTHGSLSHAKICACLRVNADSVAPDQSAHPCSMIRRAFAVR